MRPLHGLRIVSVEQFGAAPYGTIKIDSARLDRVPCSPMGADNATYLADRPVASSGGVP